MSVTIQLTRVFEETNILGGIRGRKEQPVLIAWGAGCIANVYQHKDPLDTAEITQSSIMLPNGEPLFVKETLNEIKEIIKKASNLSM